MLYIVSVLDLDFLTGKELILDAEAYILQYYGLQCFSLRDDKEDEI